ncbi:hypothetical protein ACWEVD_01270 [Nocardia thailandica]
MIEQQGRYLTADHTNHYGFLARADRWTLSWLPDVALPIEQAQAGLRIAEMAAYWGPHLLFSERIEAHAVRCVVEQYAAILGMDALDAYLRCMASDTSGGRDA